MKLLINLFGIAVAGALGYSVEPNLRYRLTGVMPTAVVTAEKARVDVKTPEGAPEVDPTESPLQQLPQRDLLKSEIKVHNAASATPTPPVARPDPAPDFDEATLPPALAETSPATAGNDVVIAMKVSISAAEIKEFTVDQVLEWTIEPNETIGGETYQVGLAFYEAETVFGVRAIRAKALIKNGKVQRWVDLNSGTDIK